MHELGLLSEMVDMIKDIKEQEHLETIEKIVLQVGEISGVLPRYLEECYPAAVYKTFMQDTKLELEIIPGIAKCRNCNEEFNAMKHDLKCPKCKGENLEALSGREFIIKEIIAN